MDYKSQYLEEIVHAFTGYDQNEVESFQKIYKYFIHRDIWILYG